MNKIKILVVEDKKENITAAKKYFETRKDVSITFATNYEDGMREIKDNIYALGIFDLELPIKTGGRIEKLGFELAKYAEKYALGWVILTSGFFHHRNSEVSFVLYEWNDLMEVKKENEAKIKKLFTLKNKEVAWKKVFEELLSSHNNLQEEIKAKERFMRFTGKSFTRKEGEGYVA